MKNVILLLIFASFSFSNLAWAKHPRACEVLGICAEGYAAPMLDPKTGKLFAPAWNGAGDYGTPPQRKDDCDEDGGDCGGLPGNSSTQ